MTNLSSNAKAAGLAVAAFTMAAAEYAVAGDMTATRFLSSTFAVVIGGVAGALVGGKLGRMIKHPFDHPGPMLGGLILGAATGMIGGAYLTDKAFSNTDQKIEAPVQSSSPAKTGNRHPSSEDEKPGSGIPSPVL